MIEEPIHARIDRDRKARQRNAAEVGIYRQYARGWHDSTMSADQLRALGLLATREGHRMADNACAMILRALVSRLALARFVVAEPHPLPDLEAPPNAPPGPGPVERYLADWWVTAQVPVLAQQVHWATARDGNHAVTLAWEGDATGRVRLAREPWWDGKRGIWVAYDDLDQPLYAVKEWQEQQGSVRRRVRVLYYPDRIERWQAEGGGWVEAPTVAADGTDVPAITPWTARDGTPLGLPVVHFRNVVAPADTDDTDPSYGVSDLAGGLIGLQDEVNDIQRDITLAARLHGFGIITATGVTFPKDDQGNSILPTIEPGMILHTQVPGGAFGVLPPGDLSQLEKALMIKLQAMSRNAATPLHLITGGDWPSGEALLRADQPLIRKVEAMGRTLGPAWGSLAHKATLLANAFGGLRLDTAALITVAYQPADGLDPLTRAQVAAAEAPFVSEAESLRTLDKPTDLQAQILQERKADRAAAPAPIIPMAPVTTNPNQPMNGTPPTNGVPVHG